MNDKEPIDVVLAFWEAVNAREVDKLCTLMCDDPVFVDGLGNKIQAKDSSRKAGRGYFQWFPDDRTSHEEIFSPGRSPRSLRHGARNLCVEGDS